MSTETILETARKDWPNLEGTFWYEEAHRRADQIEKGDDRG